MKKNKELVGNVLADFNLGASKNEIAKKYSLHRETVRIWIKKFGCVPQRAEGSDLKSEKCGFEFHHDHKIFDCKEYAYILGMYLGDGYISKGERTYRLRIFLFSEHMEILEKCKQYLKVLFPNNKVSYNKQLKSRCNTLYVYNNELPTIFPQHGKGNKHTREIKLECWQKEILNKFPEEFISGLLDSDGCSYYQTNLNNVRYYQFSNRSEDIKSLFIDYCVLLGIECTIDSDKILSIRRKEERTKLERFYLPKVVTV